MTSAAPSQQPITPQIARARHLDRMRRGRLELWRIRGATARARGEPRVVPPLARSIDPEAGQAKVEAWLAGYDGKR